MFPLKLALLFSLLLYSVTANDVVLVVANSEATSIEDFHNETQPWLKDYINKSNNIRVGVVMYESLITGTIGLMECTVQTCYGNRIDKLYIPGGGRCTPNAIAEATVMLAHSTNPSMVVVLDGPEECPDGTRKLTEVVDEARDKGIKLIAIGVGDTFNKSDEANEELKIITGGIGTRTYTGDKLSKIKPEPVIGETKNPAFENFECADKATDCDLSRNTCAMYLFPARYEEANRLYCEKTCAFCKPNGTDNSHGPDCQQLKVSGGQCDDHADCVYMGPNYSPQYQCYCSREFRAEAYKRGWKEEPCKATSIELPDYNNATSKVPCQPKDFSYLEHTVHNCDVYLAQKKLTDKYICSEPDIHYDGSLLCPYSSDTHAFFSLLKDEDNAFDMKYLDVPANEIESELKETSHNQELIDWRSYNFFCKDNEIVYSTAKPSSHPWKLNGMACIVPITGITNPNPAPTPAPVTSDNGTTTTAAPITTTSASPSTTTTITTTTTTTTTTPQPTTSPTTTTTTTTLPPTTKCCPPGGIWSEWTTTGTCATICGSCSEAPRTRTCQTEEGGCPCTGEASNVGPCGIGLCEFPTPTCCQTYGAFKKSINYVSGAFFCGVGNVEKVVNPCDGS